jgi:hypothetical protein
MQAAIGNSMDRDLLAEKKASGTYHGACRQKMLRKKKKSGSRKSVSCWTREGYRGLFVSGFISICYVQNRGYYT